MRMNRRKFIASGTGLFLASTILSACSKEDIEIIPNGKKVIVVGAGISGLAAAKKLREKGFEVLVLEADDRIGGRLKTTKVNGFDFDEGASWIHGPNGNPISEIAKNSGASTYITDDESVKVFDKDGKIYSDKILSDAEDNFDSVMEDLPRFGQLNQSFKSVFENKYPQYTGDRIWKYMLSAYLEFNTGADISELSSLYFYDDEEFRGKDEIIVNGYSKIAEFLSKDIEIKTNSVVQSIEYVGNSVSVNTLNSNFNCDYLVISVPLGILKANTIQFSPLLPDSKSIAISNLKMGVVNKFLLVWNSAFWEKDIQYIGYTPEEKGKFNYFLNVFKFSNFPALMTFAYGNYAKETESQSDFEIQNQIMAHLRSIYGAGIPDPVKLMRTQWGKNPFTLGSYSFVPVGGNSNDYNELAKPIDNKLFFAGEHTSKDYRGTVHGAYLSGIREADRIIALQ